LTIVIWHIINSLKARVVRTGISHHFTELKALGRRVDLICAPDYAPTAFPPDSLGTLATAPSPPATSAATATTGATAAASPSPPTATTTAATSNSGSGTAAAPPAPSASPQRGPSTSPASPVPAVDLGSSATPSMSRMPSPPGTVSSATAAVAGVTSPTGPTAPSSATAAPTAAATTAAAATKAAARWSWSDGDTCKKYDKAVAAVLEAAFVGKKKNVVFTLDGRKYTADFERMQQTNNSTGGSRALRVLYTVNVAVTMSDLSVKNYELTVVHSATFAELAAELVTRCSIDKSESTLKLLYNGKEVSSPNMTMLRSSLPLNFQMQGVIVSRKKTKSSGERLKNTDSRICNDPSGAYIYVLSSQYGLAKIGTGTAGGSVTGKLYAQNPNMCIHANGYITSLPYETKDQKAPC
jgi:hypothetical protein